jgi:hypothetical protein
VKGRDQWRRLQLLSFEEFFDALAHLARGLIGKGDRQDVVWSNSLFPNEIGYPNRDNARLARTGTGKDQ